MFIRRILRALTTIPAVLFYAGFVALCAIRLIIWKVQDHFSKDVRIALEPGALLGIKREGQPDMRVTAKGRVNLVWTKEMPKADPAKERKSGHIRLPFI